MNRRKLLICAIGLLFFAVFLLTAIVRPPHNRFTLGTLGGGSGVDFCFHSGDGSKGEDPAIAGAVVKVTFWGEGTDDVPDSLDPGGSILYFPVFPGVITYTDPAGRQFNGFYEIYEDVDSWSINQTLEPFSYGRNLLEYYVKEKKTVISAPLDTCLGSKTVRAPSLSVGTWAIALPPFNPTAPSGISSFSGQAHQMP